MADVRGGSKGNFKSRLVSMGRFIQKVRYNNPNQKGIQTQISGITGLVKDGICGLIIDLDSTFSGIMLWVMRLISDGGYVILEKNM